MDLAGVVDLHLHTAPDVRQRSLDDLEAARAALAHRMGGVLLKNHHAPTAARAAVARLAVRGAPVYGGVVLNEFVGGLNPAAVAASVQMGGRAVWLPTFSAQNHRRVERLGDDGIALRDSAGKPLPALVRVLELAAEHDLLLSTGHVSADEVLAVVPLARRIGVKKILVQHAEHSVVALTHDQQRALADQGAFIERCYGNPRPGGGTHELMHDRNLASIHAVGAASTVLSSDLGQPENPSWPDGFAASLDRLLEAGVSAAELDVMCRQNPARLLGLAI
ncbi:MAG TPA: DUF6282 family protein [Chloroflexota bacterium]|nr:DUF6282 family protein [Chloroflexota bacterium]